MVTARRALTHTQEDAMTARELFLDGNTYGLLYHAQALEVEVLALRSVNEALKANIAEQQQAFHGRSVAYLDELRAMAQQAKAS